MQTVLVVVIVVVVGVCFWAGLSQAMCNVGCTASAIYVVSSDDILSDIAKRFQVNDYTTLQAPNNISNANDLTIGQLLRIPFDCECIGQDLGHNFSYTTVQGDEVDTIASTKYGNLTTGSWIDNANPNTATFVDVNVILSIPVNCSCGNASVSQHYGLFGTYAAQANDTLDSLSHDYNISTELLRQYNPTVSFDPLQPFVSILFIPIKNSSGQYPPLNSVSAAGGRSSGKGIIVGATVGGGGVFLLLVGLGIWFLCVRRLRKRRKFSYQDKHQSQIEVDDSAAKKQTSNTDSFQYLSNKPGALPADGCIAFSFEELAAATDNFSLAKEIGRGGFAVVFYGEWQGQRLAVKRMAMKETKEFFNELRILSSVHHANLVGLVGYCTEGYLFLVYEYVDNGTLAHHLRSKTDVLPWTKRVQIALDAARGIEYIHDHTRPTYIHRDLKPSNILLDLNHRAKVGDFGLTRLINPDGDGLTNTLARHGTFGYMAPEYAQFGQVSVKLDTYAFGVVLFQIVSGMEALLGQNKQLISVFDDVLSQPDSQELFKSLVDPALGTNYPVESVWKMVILAARCTRNEPELRPQMREVVIELIMLSHDVTHNVESHT